MKTILSLLFCAFILVSFGPPINVQPPVSEATDFVKVYFLYGSKPTKEQKNTEPKWFGGKHGGHVGIEGMNDKIVSFLPSSKTHIFSKKKGRKSRFVNTSETGFWQILGGNEESVKKMVIHIPVTEHQKTQLDSIHQVYLTNSPYDYAFFGMRCAAATYEILGQVGVHKSYSNSRTWKKIFYPKKLRTRMIKKAKRYGWKVEKIAGSNSRKWEQDKSKLE